jgi:hypothetical protein
MKLFLELEIKNLQKIDVLVVLCSLFKISSCKLAETRGRSCLLKKLKVRSKEGGWQGQPILLIRNLIRLDLVRRISLQYPR